MQPKTTTCVVCGEQVGKRQSLAYKNGRACRNHDEVTAFIAKQEQDKKDAAEKAKQAEGQRQKDKETNKRINDMMSMIAQVSWVQVQHSIHGHSPEAIYRHIALFRGQEFADKVKEEVDKQGGPYIDPAQLVADALYFKSLLG